jgi:UDP-N-acetylmuramyl tripeptide synthase
MAAGLIRDILAVNFSKLTTKLIKFFGLGSASSLPGRVALALSPNILKNFASKLNQTADFSFFITGTNGKTTSTGLLKQILQASLPDQEIICNDYGANLYYGITAELVRSSNSLAELVSRSYALEVDEATLPKLARELYPRTLAITNLFRDQLDRFGEIDSTQKLLLSGIKNIIAHAPSLNLVLNADDPKVALIKDLLAGEPEFSKIKTFFYCVKFSDPNKSYAIQDLDSTKPKSVSVIPDIVINIQQENINSSIINYSFKNFTSESFELKLPGLYNVYNSATAISCALVAGIGFEEIKNGIKNYHSAFGRSEIKFYKNKKYQSFLIKNPTGCSEVLRHLSSDHSANFLIAINDNFADGRDVSWLWDARFEYLTEMKNSHFVCSGNRAYDMALRLKYAGIQEERITSIQDLKSALNYCLDLDLEKSVYVLPTYTALLDLQTI